ncbi:hypothetical protein BJY00DRAFT_318303 [Aspergillus carlsbadensis]|nr:hypothetical protein BJY00DRAFT_318303 [Aspergillus carlsbadensis]
MPDLLWWLAFIIPMVLQVSPAREWLHHFFPFLWPGRNPYTTTHQVDDRLNDRLDRLCETLTTLQNEVTRLRTLADTQGNYNAASQQRQQQVERLVERLERHLEQLDRLIG